MAQGRQSRSQRRGGPTGRHEPITSVQSVSSVFHDELEKGQATSKGLWNSNSTDKTGWRQRSKALPAAGTGRRKAPRGTIQSKRRRNP